MKIKRKVPAKNTASVATVNEIKQGGNMRKKEGSVKGGKPSKVTESSLMTWLERYTNHGFRVLPVRERDKKPGLKNWTAKATNILSQAKHLFINDRSNIGIACGPGSHLVVIDIDLPDGFKSLEIAQKELGKLPPTLCQKTGSGGVQMFFQYPDGRSIRNSAGTKLGVDIDIRGEGGCVVVPPSIHPNGKSYEWQNWGTLPATLPDAWVRRLTDERNAPDSRRGKGTGNNVQDILQRLASATPGTRNDTLNKAAFLLGQLAETEGLTEADAQILLYDAALKCGLVADGSDAVISTIKSGFSKGVEKAHAFNNGSHQYRAMRRFFDSIGRENIIFTQGAFWMWNGKIWHLCDKTGIAQIIQREEEKGGMVSSGLVKSTVDLIQNECFVQEHKFDLAEGT